MQTKRYWLDYDPIAFAALVVGIGMVRIDHLIPIALCTEAKVNRPAIEPTRSHTLGSLILSAPIFSSARLVAIRGGLAEGWVVVSGSEAPRLQRRQDRRPPW